MKSFFDFEKEQPKDKNWEMEYAEYVCTEKKMFGKLMCLISQNGAISQCPVQYNEFKIFAHLLRFFSVEQIDELFETGKITSGDTIRHFLIETTYDILIKLDDTLSYSSFGD